MCDLLTFQRARTPRRWHEPSSREPSSGQAEIIIFPGVRYVRMPDPAEAPKPPRAPRRRERAKKEKVS